MVLNVKVLNIRMTVLRVLYSQSSHTENNLWRNLAGGKLFEIVLQHYELISAQLLYMN